MNLTNTVCSLLQFAADLHYAAADALHTLADRIERDR